MSELVQATSGATLTSSAVSEPKESPAASGADDSSTKHIDKLLKEKQNYAKGLNDVKQKYEQLLSEKQQREEQELLNTRQHEKVIELQRSEITELKGTVGSFEKRETEGRKNIAILGELKRLGFVENEVNKDLAMRLFDKGDVEIDPTANIVMGADLAAKTFYDKYHHLGLFGQKTVGVNQDATRGVGQPLTLEEWRKLPVDEQVSRQKEVEEAIGYKRTL